MDIHPGDIVYSKAGRDKGKYFFVTQMIDDQYVYICDGDIRRLEKPKKKKLKHLQGVSTGIPQIKQKLENSQKLTNSELRKGLAAFISENQDSIEGQQKGGCVPWQKKM